MRAIIYRPAEGNWYCKGVGQKDWNNTDNNIVFNHGSLCDQPIILDIFGDGPRACTYRKNEGTINVKTRGRFSWNDKKSEFGYLSGNTTITCMFPGSKGGNYQHDQLFAFTPTIATLSKGPIHPIVYRGTEQLFYVQSQTGTKVSQLMPTKFWYITQPTRYTFHNIPFHNTPFHQTPFHNAPFHNTSTYNSSHRQGFTGSHPIPSRKSLIDHDFLAAKFDIWKIGSFHFQYGAAGDIPIFADFFNENICRPGVFRPSTGYWYIKALKDGINGGKEISFKCGQPNSNDVPFVCDIFNEGILWWNEYKKSKLTAYYYTLLS